MELRQYLVVLQRGFGIILSITAIFTIIVTAIIYFSPSKYDATTSITVDRPISIDQKNVNYYLYDNYYSQQSSGLLADTIINWTSSPSIVKAIYARAGVVLPEVRKVASLGKIFTVRKLPPATVSVTIRSDNESDGQVLLKATIAELKERSLDLSQVKGGDQIELHDSGVASAVVKPYWGLNLLISILTGLILGLFSVFIRENLRPSKRE